MIFLVMIQWSCLSINERIPASRERDAGRRLLVDKERDGAIRVRPDLETDSPRR